MQCVARESVSNLLDIDVKIFIEVYDASFMYLKRKKRLHSVKDVIRCRPRLVLSLSVAPVSTNPHHFSLGPSTFNS